MPHQERRRHFLKNIAMLQHKYNIVNHMNCIKCTCNVKRVLQHRNRVRGVASGCIGPIDRHRHAQRAQRVFVCGHQVLLLLQCEGAGGYGIPGCVGRDVSSVMLAVGSSLKRATTGSSER